MKIVYKSQHKSIAGFDPIDLPKFTILTGLNGSGKTQLLNALNEGQVQADSIAHLDVIYFNYTDFKVKNEPAYLQQTVSQEIKNAWNEFGKMPLPQSNQRRSKDTLKQMRTQSLQDNECESLKDISKQKSKPLWYLDDQDIADADLRAKFQKYRTQIQYHLMNSNPERPTNKNLFMLLKKLPYFLDEIEEAEFMRMFEPVTLKNNFLPESIGKTFLSYRIKEHEEFHRNVTQYTDKKVGDVITQSTQKILEKHGGVTPWDFLNNILSEYNNFDYVVSIPKEIDYDMYNNPANLSFNPQLKNKQNNISVDYESLSSGESVLFALAVCLFKTKTDNLFPELLLLDEIDSTLHPSMIENLFKVINNVFLKNGTKVIMATHSPTTIALSEEESIYVVNKKGPNRIEKIDKKTALNILTQGVATLEKGLKLFDQVSRKELSIITEGNNIDYIKKAIDVFTPDKKDRIDVIAGFEHKTGKVELKILFDFFAIAKPNNKVMFVWDRDFGSKIEEKNNTFGFVFGKNESNKLEKNTGIECQFDHEYTKNYVLKTTDTDGTLESTHFKGNKKQEFKDYILVNGDADAFKNFKPLVERIIKLLDTNV